MQVKDILRLLNLGDSVAEEDKDLDSYFVETETFRQLITDKGDVIAGDKGTGKTALYRILNRRYSRIPALNKVEVVTAFNPTGDSVFQRLAMDKVLTVGQYITVWKAYILSLAGNWLLELYDENDYTPSMKKLDALLRRAGLRVPDDKPTTIFSRLFNLIRRYTQPEAAGIEFTFNEAGFPESVMPKVEFSDKSEDSDSEEHIIRHTESLGLLNAALEEADLSVWLVLDRLDEAFQGYPETEVPALRALLRTYLDMKEFDRIRLKMFVRNDLFRKVTRGTGFVNLTHIRRIDVVWDDEDLLNLLIRRINTNKEFVDTLGLEGKSAKEIFYTLFPDQVDAGTGRSKTWNWILARIRDGNNVKPPRNLIDLIKRAQEEQQRREGREGEAREFDENGVLITSEAIKNALSRLSVVRVEDTLLAESGVYAQYIEKFRDGKAEHNGDSLLKTLGLPANQARVVTKVLIDMGFLEQTGETYKVPMLYRDGLNITQGKAFQPEEFEENLEPEEDSEPSLQVQDSDQNEGSTSSS